MIVRESISFEGIQFQRGLPPTRSMDIGLNHVINDFLNGEDKNRSYPDPETWISALLFEIDDNELSPEIKKRWIKYLIEDSRYNKKLDENDYIGLKERGISWIPYIPFSDSDFKYEKIGENYFILFSDWSAFIEYFDTTSRNINEKFIKAVLSGDSFEYFEYDLEQFENITDLGWNIQILLNRGNKIPAIKDLKKIAIKMGGDPKNMKTVETLFEEININNKLEDLKDAITLAYAEAQQSADESEAFNDLIKAIKKQYKIENGEWVENPHKEANGDWKEAYYKAPISKSGLEDLFYTSVTGEEKIKYYPPDNYMGQMSSDTINDAILNKLDDLER